MPTDPAVASPDIPNPSQHEDIIVQLVERIQGKHRTTLSCHKAALPRPRCWRRPGRPRADKPYCAGGVFHRRTVTTEVDKYPGT
jgi:hypothetical protein